MQGRSQFKFALYRIYNNNLTSKPAVFIHLSNYMPLCCEANTTSRTTERGRNRGTNASSYTQVEVDAEVGVRVRVGAEQEQGQKQKHRNSELFCFVALLVVLLRLLVIVLVVYRAPLLLWRVTYLNLLLMLSCPIMSKK